MAGMSDRRFKMSAVAATTATLVPVDGENTKGDFADSVASVLVTFTNARDSRVFDIVNRQIIVSLEQA